MSRNRRFLSIASVLIGLGAVLGGNFAPGYASGVLLEVGAALFLLPAVVWTEQRLSARIEETRASLADVADQFRSILAQESDATERAIAAMTLEARWEDVWPTLAKINLLTYQTQVVVPMPTAELWLGFSTSPLQILGEFFTPVHLYYSDPTDSDRPHIDTTVRWSSETTFMEFMARVATVLRRDGRFPGVDRFRPEEPVLALQEEVAVLLRGSRAPGTARNPSEEDSTAGDPTGGPKATDVTRLGEPTGLPAQPY